jgi:hypothetical protein
MEMTLEGVKVQMQRSYMRYRTGQVVTVTAGLARSLELAGYAKRLQDEPQLQFATAPEPAGVERAETPTAKRGRRKRA